MKDWNSIFNNLSDEEKNKIAILRVIECSNGVVQHMFRANDENALSIEETRDAMKFSMGCMKTMSIPLKSHTVTFAEETASVMHEVRELYISGFKNGNQEDLEEFMSDKDVHSNGRVNDLLTMLLESSIIFMYFTPSLGFV